jgi:zinc transport system substrate-binding protein
MKKRITALACALLSLSVAFTGCTKTTDTENSGKLQVYTSFYALYDFAEKIGGDDVELVNIVPTGTEPHDWEPTVHDMASLENCDILFYNGLGMESWIEKVQSSVTNDIEYVELADGLANENAEDPHVWLSPVKAKEMAEKIKDTLVANDSENAEDYEQNYNDFAEELDELDEEYKSSLSNVDNKSIVVSHEAYSYLCDEYGLEQIAIDGIFADSEPSPDKMKEIVNFINDNNIKYIFYEELISKKTAQTLADETGAVLLSLNPYEGLTDDEIAQGEDYISVMEENLQNLKLALGD